MKEEDIRVYIQERFKNERFIIKVGNLYCRPLKESDLKLIKEIHNDHKCSVYLVSDVGHNDEEIAKWINKLIQKYNESGLSTYVVCNINEAVGIAGFGLTNDAKVTIHYAFPVSSQRKGYCTKICQELVRFAFEDLKIECLHAKTLSYNKVSQVILRRLGFQPDGTILSENYKDEYVTLFLRDKYSFIEEFSKNAKPHEKSRDFRDLILEDYKNWFINRSDSEVNKKHNKRIKNFINLHRS